MILRRIFDEKLAQASYLVACDRSKLGLVVDPNRNVAQYVQAAAEQRIRIVAVTETHIHADFVSGARELALRTAAQLYLSDSGTPDWKYGYANDARAELLTDGSQFTIGDVRIDVLHTPGHTPEHLTFLVTDTATGGEPMGAFTGDFIFVGDVGRPDLLERAAGMKGTMEAGARQLFASLRSFRTYPDYLQIWPGHGAGSACGKALGAMPQSTLGYEKLFNWALAETDEERFVAEVLAGQPEPPAYFAIMKQVNRDGPPTGEPQVPDEAETSDLIAAADAGAMIVDTRPASRFAVQHVQGSINVPANKSFLKWAGSLLSYDADVWVIGASGENARRALASDLALIGLDRVRGVYSSDRVADLATAGIEMNTLAHVTVDEVRARRNGTILDVRGRSEYDEGHIRGAINIPLGELQQRIDEVPGGDVVVQCQGGSRSAIAASILQKEGIAAANMSGGFDGWERAGNPVVRGDNGGG